MTTFLSPTPPGAGWKEGRPHTSAGCLRSASGDVLESKTPSPPQPGSSDRALSPGGGRGQSLHTPLPPSSGGHPGASPVQARLEPGAEHRAQTRPRGGQAWDREAGPCCRRPPPSPAPPQAPDNPSPRPWLLRAATGGTGLPRDPQASQGSWALTRAGRAPVTSLCQAGGPRPAHHWLSVQKGDSRWGGHQLGTSGGGTRAAPGPEGPGRGSLGGVGGGDRPGPRTRKVSDGAGERRAYGPALHTGKGSQCPRSPLSGVQPQGHSQRVTGWGGRRGPGGTAQDGASPLTCWEQRALRGDDLCFL